NRTCDRRIIEVTLVFTTGGNSSASNRRGIRDAIPALLLPEAEVLRPEVTAIYRHRRTSLFQRGDQISLFRTIAKTYSRESQFLPRRLSRDNQRDLLHLGTCWQCTVHVIRVVADRERHFAQWTKHAEDRFLALPEPFLSVRPVAGSAERLAITRP